MSENFERFINIFDVEKVGFGKPIPLIDAGLGFSTIKHFKDTYYTMAKVFIRSEDLDNISLERKPIYLKMDLVNKRDGEYFSEIGKIKMPLNLLSRDDFFCDLEHRLLYEHGQIIDGATAFGKIYKLHTKSTKSIGGLYLRTKIRFFRTIPRLIGILKTLAYYQLFLISGERYNYNVIGKESRSMTGHKQEGSEKERKVEISMLGYSGSFWSVVAYSAIHFALFTIFFLCEYKPLYIKTVLTNNFLTAIYIVSSLCIFEKLLPQLLKPAIVHLSKLEFGASVREVRL
jgi:hypothetical protein